MDHHDNVWVTDVAKHQVFKVRLPIRATYYLSNDEISID